MHVQMLVITPMVIEFVIVHQEVIIFSDHVFPVVELVNSVLDQPMLNVSIAQVNYVWNGAKCVLISASNCQLYSAGACVACNAGYYLYWDSTCQATCSAPYLAFGDGDYKVCQTPCQSSEYMYWDNTCLSSCASPLKTVVQGSAQFCQFPCPTTTDYLYWDGTCSATCSYYPRVWTWKKFCDPCPSGLYLYPDKSCQITCSSPYQIKPVGTANLCNPICTGGKFLLGSSTCLLSCPFNFQATMVREQSVCSFPCTDTSQYLYWNGSCISRCPYTSTTYGTYKFCTGCSAGYYLYPDGTCLSLCVAPLYASTVTGTSFQECHYPCSGSLTAFSGASYLKCPALYSYPYSVAATHDCGLDLSPNLSIQMQAVAAVINGLALMVSALAVIVMFVSPKNPTPFCLLLSFKMLEHLKYILAKYPARLQQVLNYQGFAQGILNISPTIPDRVVSAFPHHNLPAQFSTYGLYSSFFVNSWNPLISLVTVAVIALVIIAFEAWVKDLKFVRWIISSIKPAITLPNFFILFLLSTYYNDLIIFTSMELRTLHLKSFVSVFSFLIMLIINILILFFIIKIFYAFKEARKEVTQIRDVNGPAALPRDEWKYKDYQIFFEACKEEAYLHHIFIFAYLVKTYLYTIFIAYIFAYPFISSFFTTFTSGLILLFILLQNCFKDKMHQIQFLTQEAILTIANACVLVIASLDSTCKQAFALREALGGILLACYFSLIVAGGIFMIKTIRDVVARKIAAGRFIRPTRDMVAPAIAVEQKPKTLHPWASYTPNFKLEQKMDDVSPNVSQKLDVDGHSADRKNETMDLFLVTNANESRLMERTNRSNHLGQGEENMVARKPNKIKFDTSDLETVYKKKESQDPSFDNHLNHSQRRFRGTWKSNNGPDEL